MADDTADDAVHEARRGRVRHAVVVACVFVLALAGIGAAAWRIGVGQIEPQARGVPAAVVTGARDGALEPMDPFIVNLSDEDGHRYLKATLQVEFHDAVVPAEFRHRLPHARDMLLTLFSSKSFADVRTPQGKAVLREEIVNRLNTVLDGDAVKAVYLTEFIVQ